MKLLIVAVLSFVTTGLMANEKDLTVFREVLQCEALWRCAGDQNELGAVRSEISFKGDEEAACRQHLLDLASESGLCEEYEVHPGSFEAFVERRTITLLTCSSGHGEELCDAIDHLESELSWDCTGTACYRLWERQGRAMDSVTDVIQGIVSIDSTESSEAIVSLARSVAYTMCNVDRTGHSSALERITRQNNRAGVALRDIQELGDWERGYLCRLVIN